MLRFRLSRERMLTNILAFIICFAVFLLTISPPQSLAAKATSPEEVTRQFYSWYFGAKFPEPKQSNRATFRKYVTQSFLKRATAPDVDSVLFIDAQDMDETWANNFTVSKATINGQKASVDVALNGKEMKYSLHVTLRREGSVWKIDDVKGSSA